MEPNKKKRQWAEVACNRWRSIGAWPRKKRKTDKNAHLKAITVYRTNVEGSDKTID